jgi:hypothetical protein
MTRIKREKPIISTPTLALILAACGGGGGGGGGSNPDNAGIRSGPVTRKGRVIDGPIVGANVYVDVNENGEIDEGVDIELGTTNSEGLYSGEVAAQHADKPLLADLDGAHDKDDPDTTLSGLWRAPEAASVISPLTELMVRDELSARELALLVGLPDNIDVSKMDPLEIIPQNVAYAQQLLAVGRFVAAHLDDDNAPDILTLELDIHENHPRNKAVFDLRGGTVTLTDGYGDNNKFEVRDGNRIWFKSTDDFDGSPDFENGETEFNLQIERVVNGETKIIQLTLNVADIELERLENVQGSGVGFHSHKRSDYNKDDLPSEFTQHILAGSYWDSPADKPLTLTWSIDLREIPQNWIDAISHLTDASTQSVKTQTHIDLLRQLIQRATQEIEKVANIKFIEVDGNPNTGEIGDLNFWFVNHIEGFSGFAYYPSEISSHVFLRGSSLATLTTLENFNYGFVQGLRKIYLHEIGHALGLGHPFEENAEWLGNPEYRLSPATQMSYARITNSDGLKPADIEALQWLYGAPDEHGTGAEFLDPPVIV